MIEVYTCPICGGKQRVLIDDKTNKPIPHTRCVYNGCKSYDIPVKSNEQYCEAVDAYRKLIGKNFRLSVDGKSGYREVVIDVQNDKSVILVDRADYLPVRLTSKQFEVYQDACKEYEKQLQQEIDTNHQDD